MSSSHILFSALPAWGHARPLCVLAARIMAENPNIICTILVPPNLLSKAHAEVEAEVGVVDEDTLRRIRIVSPHRSENLNPFELHQPYSEAYPIAYRALINGEKIQCAVHETIFDAAPPPTLHVLDFLAFFLIKPIEMISGRSIPILAWITGHVSFFIRQYGPKHLGGRGPADPKAVEEAMHSGRLHNESQDKFYQTTNGSIVKLPGIPPMFDHEFFPQVIPFTMPISMVINGAQYLLDQSEGVIVASAYAFEKDSIEALKGHFGGVKKDVFVVGPLSPKGHVGQRHEKNQDEDTIKQFLDATLQTHGENSIIYISFGTVFWPIVPGYMEEVIECLLEKEFPFILSTASPFTTISAELSHKIKLSGHGICTQWSPQKYILQHPATGWFLTHCGQNSTLEALANGVPMITWPFEADQPAVSFYLSEVLKVAFELFEVRTGEKGLKPLHRNKRTPKGSPSAVGSEMREVIDSCRSEKGRELRRNAICMQERFAKAWDSQGVSSQEVMQLLSKYVDGDEKSSNTLQIL